MLTRIWEESPFGLVIYQPIFANDDVLDDLVLLWVNRRIVELTGRDEHEFIDRRMSDMVGADWLNLKVRFAVSIATEKPFRYARSYDDQPASFDYSATAWYSRPYVTVLITQESESSIPMLSDPTDIEAGTRLVEASTARTLELVRLLRSVNGDGSVVAEL